MLCPFCLQEVRFGRGERKGAGIPSYVCPAEGCKQEVPAMYVEGYQEYPPVVVSAIGFRAHGKTVYLASLFYTLKKLRLARHWPEFFTMGLNEESFETVASNVGLLEAGTMPPASMKNFPRPTMVRLSGIPMEPNCTVLCYDTGGECFEKPSQLVMHASFVKRARTAMFLIDLHETGDPAEQAHKLLSAYVVGMADLGADTREQDLVVVYTKGDEITHRLVHWPDLREYLTQGFADKLADSSQYISRMHKMSDLLRRFTGDELGAYEFATFARKSFRSVSYSIVSALGARPQNGHLPVRITPRRVIDPLLWLMERSQPGWRQAWRRWRT